MTYNIDINMYEINKKIGYLELCIGPMFAGKTTYLLNMIDKFNKSNIKFSVLKPVIDIRYDKNMIVSHNNNSYKCIILNDFDELMNHNLENIILIEEGQFFKDLDKQIKIWLALGKQIYVAGLNGDYLMKPLGNIIDLIPFADNIIYLKAVCECSKPASFSKRKKVNNDEQILVGSSDIYLPTCRECYYSDDSFVSNQNNIEI
jgi:thymidine kinase